jgi:predicted 2-oxoglutarate/Fe(II)-dependent dioxygenase YbiX
MNKNIKDYVLTAESVIPVKLCEDIIKEINKNKKTWYKHKWTNGLGEEIESVNGKKHELINVHLKTENSEKIMKILWSVIKGYQNKLRFPWFSTWQSYSQVRFNIYKKNQKMENHCDHISSLFEGTNKGVPILSLLGSLNNNYKGGEFIMFDKEEYKIKQGDVLIFPSNFIYPHRVEPVTKGTRYSFISWVW